MSIKKTSWKWGKRFLGTLGFLFAFNTAAIPITYLINQNINSERKTIVFTSGKNDFSDYRIPEIPNQLMILPIDFFMYVPITLRQNLKGNSVYWSSNPNLETFVEEIQNSDFENIILVGHGSKDSFALPDGSADVNYLRQFYLPPRQGEFYQYTCGDDGESGKKLKDLLFRECTRSKTFDGILDPFTSYACAWTDSEDESE